MRAIIEILDELKANSSLTRKEEILFDNDSQLLRQVLVYALDPYRVFGVRQIPAYTKVETPTMPLNVVFGFLDSMADGELTGNKASAKLADMLSSLSEADATVLKRIIDKDLKAGIKAKMVNAVFPKLIPQFDLMAAYLYETKKAKYPCWAEPKIDGMRCVFFVYRNSEGEKFATCYSRGGKEIETLGTIKKHILDLYPDNSVVDGEVVTDGAFEDAMSIIRRKAENAKEGNIYFNVFDVLSVDEFENQVSDLTLKQRREQRFHKEDTTWVKANPYTVVNSEEEAEAFYEKCIDEGYEGVILKNPNAPYEYKRSNHWLKIKPEETLDLTIIGSYEGEAGTKNEGKLGGFVVDYKGKPVRVGGGFKEKVTADRPENERVKFWREKEEMVGDMIEVKFMEETKDGSLRHPRFVRLRSYKGEKV